MDCKSVMPAVAVLLALAVVPSCVATRSHVDHVESRVAALEKATSTVLADAARETKRLENLATSVEESSGQLREAAARSGARLQDFERAVQRLKGEFEVVLRRLDVAEKVANSGGQGVADLRQRLNQLVADLRDRAGITILALPPDVPADGPGLARLAADRYGEGDIRVAAAVAAHCKKLFPRTEPGAACTLLLGRIAAEEHRWADATGHFEEVHNWLADRKHVYVGEALIEIAKLLEAQGECQKATGALKYLMSDFGKLPHGKLAKDMIASQAQRCKQGVGLVAKPGTKVEGPGVEPPADPSPTMPAPRRPPAGDAPDLKRPAI
ncbi:MAG: hypothetical protein EXR79_12600 [Myxococcales bacterium]|nr:hypothetical protein [Myxococcales bacterium]